MNFYAYVGNDPVNFADPSGLAKCGNLSGKECEQALDDADAAKAQVDKVAEGVGKLADKMANGEELTEGEQEAVDAIGEKFGDRFTSQKGLEKLSKRMGRISQKIGVRGQGMKLMSGKNKKANVVAYVIPFINRVYVNDLHYEQTTAFRQATMVHEAAHISKRFGDQYIRDGINPTYGKRSAWRQADTYACLAFPSACGF